MKTENAVDAATQPDSQEAPERVKLIQVVRSTSMFAGWGPRMEGNIAAILRNRN